MHIWCSGVEHELVEIVQYCSCLISSLTAHKAISASSFNYFANVTSVQLFLSLAQILFQKHPSHMPTFSSVTYNLLHSHLNHHNTTAHHISSNSCPNMLACNSSAAADLASLRTTHTTIIHMSMPTAAATTCHVLAQHTGANLPSLQPTVLVPPEPLTATNQLMHGAHCIAALQNFISCIWSNSSKRKQHCEVHQLQHYHSGLCSAHEHLGCQGGQDGEAQGHQPGHDGVRHNHLADNAAGLPPEGARQWQGLGQRGVIMSV